MCVRGFERRYDVRSEGKEGATSPFFHHGNSTSSSGNLPCVSGSGAVQATDSQWRFPCSLAAPEERWGGCLFPGHSSGEMGWVSVSETTAGRLPIDPAIRVLINVTNGRYRALPFCLFVLVSRQPWSRLPVMWFCNDPYSKWVLRFKQSSVSSQAGLCDFSNG